MKKHFVSLLFLVLAVVFYSMGAAGPGTFLLILGGLAEITFWIRLFSKDKGTTRD